MKTELIEHSPTRKELHIEIDAEQVRAARERVVGNYSKQARVAGFRPGRAPQSVVAQRFKDDIRQDVLREVVPQALHDAIEEQGFQVIGEPDVHFADEEQLAHLGDAALKLHAHVEVLPDIEIGEYKNLNLTRRLRPVKDEDVEEVVNNLREAAASLAPVEDRASNAGDTVTVNFRGRYIQPPDQEDINAEDVDVVIGGSGVLEDFSEQLTGVREADERTFTIKYPEDFTSKGLAGKEIEYTATVTAVGVKELPELDDEFAKSLGEEEAATMDELRAKIRESLMLNVAAEADANLRGEAIDQLVTAHQIEMPATLVQYQTRQLLETMMRDLMRAGSDPRNLNLDWQEMQKALQRQATDELRASMVLERIADDENIEATADDVEAEIQAYASAARQPLEQVRDALTKQDANRSIADRLRNRKALDFVVANANITEGEWQEFPAHASFDDEEIDALAASENAPGDEQTSTEATATDDATDDVKHNDAQTAS